MDRQRERVENYIKGFIRDDLKVIKKHRADLKKARNLKDLDREPLFAAMERMGKCMDILDYHQMTQPGTRINTTPIRLEDITY